MWSGTTIARAINEILEEAKPAPMGIEAGLGIKVSSLFQ
jgi:hypothetical protein